MPNSKRRQRVLIEPPETVVRKLKAAPGQWFLIGIGEKSDSRTLAQTAYRIRENYRLGDDGKRHGLQVFAEDETGFFEASSTADSSRPDQVAEAELSARWVLRAT
jgi:hypothetical protein